MPPTPPNPCRFIGANFILRPYQASDAPLLAEALQASQSHLATFMPWVNTDLDETFAHQSITRMVANFDLRTDFCLGIFSPDNSQQIGGTGYHIRDLPQGTAKIGIWIHADWSNKGLGTSIASSLLDWGFHSWDWQQLEWHCTKTNLASIRVAEKVGFSEPTTRPNHCYQTGSGKVSAYIFAQNRPL